MLNNNFKDLVQKYDRYRSQQRRQKLLILASLLAVIGLGFWIIFNNQFIMKSFQMTRPESSTTVTSTTPAAAQKVQEAEESNFEVDTTVENSAPQEIVKPVERVTVETPTTEDLPTEIQKRAPAKTQTAEKSPFKLQVTERKSLYNLLVKHKDENSFDSALGVAQFYFDEKDYDNAVTWSVKASKKNPKDERPWLIYAKSKAMQGKTDIAKKALTIYLEHTNSKEAQDLLDTLK